MTIYVVQGSEDGVIDAFTSARKASARAYEYATQGGASNEVRDLHDNPVTLRDVIAAVLEQDHVQLYGNVSSQVHIF